jgi:RNA-directed DNA polymerase
MEGSGHRMVRYADDFVILCHDAEEAETCLAMVTQWCGDMGLTVHPDKSGTVDMSVAGNHFVFLGYKYHRSVKSGNLNRYPSAKACRKLRYRLSPYLKRTNGCSMEAIVNMVNPILRGWFNYFLESPPWSLDQMSGWVRMRLCSILPKRRKGKGRGRGKDHQR